MSRLFAVIPAAGHSRRMGRPKLTLPFRGTTVLGRLLDTLSVPQLAVRCVVVRRDDVALQQVAEAHAAWVVQPPIDPPDMRASVEFALERIAERFQPDEDEGWLLVPADHPHLPARLLHELLEAWNTRRPQILVPTCQGRRGHPTLFRWRTVAALTRLPTNRGLNWLLEHFADDVMEWPCLFPEVTQDLDTPDDYQRLLGEGALP